MEELAYISTNVVHQDKTTTGVLVGKLFNIENHLIQNDKLAPIFNLSAEFTGAHSCLR